MTLDPSSLGLTHHAREFPSRLAISFGERLVSYGELNRRVNQLAHALRRVGVNVGDTVAAALPNGVEWFELLNAAGKLGARLVPIGYRLKAPEIAYMVTDSRARVMLGDISVRNEIDRALEQLGWSDDRLWVVGNAAPWRGQSYEALLAAESTAEPSDAFIGGGFNALVYTSGTTGRPKGVDRDVDPARGHLQLLGIAQLWQLTPDDVHLVNGPLYHTAPSSYAQVHLLIGAQVVLMSHFDAAEALRLIEAYRVTNSFMVPTHFARILQIPADQRSRRDLSSLRFVLHSAAPCPPHIKRGIMEVMPPNTVTEFYGSSESGFTKITAEEWVKKPGSVGTPWPGHTVKILDDDGKECPPGKIGLIYVKSPVLNFHYRDAEAKNQAAFRDGYFTAGDLGYLDADGYLYIADRRTDLIISGGANIYPAEVEAVLMQHPAVADAAVVGIADADMGKAVLAVVELRVGSQASAAELLEHTRQELAHYKCPKRIELVAELPREPQGKVRKHELAQRYS